MASRWCYRYPFQKLDSDKEGKEGKKYIFCFSLLPLLLISIQNFLCLGSGNLLNSVLWFFSEAVFVFLLRTEAKNTISWPCWEWFILITIPELCLGAQRSEGNEFTLPTRCYKQAEFSEPWEPISSADTSVVSCGSLPWYFLFIVNSVLRRLLYIKCCWVNGA